MKRIFTLIQLLFCLSFLMQAANPEPTITGPSEFCEGTVVTLDAGAGYATYTWSNLAAGQAITVSTGGTYSVTVTDATGCTGTDTFVLQSVTSPLNLETPYYLCQGDTICLNTDPYEWTTEVTSQGNCFTQDTIFTITVTDDNGCEFAEEIQVIVGVKPPIFQNTPQDITIDCGEPLPPLFSLPYTNQRSGDCESTGVIGGTMQGNSNPCTGGNISYTWSGEDAFENALEYTQTITVNPAPAPIFTFVPPDLTLECTDIPPVDPLTYDNGLLGICAINGIATGIEIDNFETCPRTIQRIWEAPNACGNVVLRDTQTITIIDETPPIMDAPPADITICDGELPEPQPLFWTDNCGLMGETEGDTTMVDGNIIATWTTTDICGNSTVATQLITVASTLDVQIDGPDAICEGNAFGIPLCVVGNYISYIWNTGENTDCIVPTVGGTYAVLATDVNGCEAYGEFVVEENSALIIDLGADQFICEGESVLLNAGSGYSTYLWSDGSVNQTVIVTQIGTYCVTVVDGIGCSGEACVEVIEIPNPEPQITGSTTFCTGTSTILDAGSGYETYTWSTSNTSQKQVL